MTAIPPNKKNTTDFGFTEVPIQEKSSRVANVFDSVASKYDLMNDVMSLGIHRLWKRFTLQQSGIRASQTVLDIAGGTGDLTKEFSKKVGKDGRVILADINFKMLTHGRARLEDQGMGSNIHFVQADAEALPFQNNYFDCISIAFGLRNVTHKLAALQSMYRVLKPGGKLLILEFSKPKIPLVSTVYDAYSFHVIPKLGGLITGDHASYQYLVESIRMHPDQQNLKLLMEEAAFEDVTYHNLSGGIVALHQGFKY
jgi:demethylmenaquinone methyltransferase / 2-methoxy-6-polyprenyl-1,4-benzoquinol methylase